MAVMTGREGGREMEVRGLFQAYDAPAGRVNLYSNYFTSRWKVKRRRI